MSKIGIIDSGLGGFSVLDGLLKHHPNHEYYYLADQANAPYGDKSHTQLLAYASNLVEMLIAKDVYEIIVACNTLCSSVLPTLRLNYPLVNFTSIIEPTIKQVGEANKVLVLATNATIQSHAYLNGLLAYNSNLIIDELAAPTFVPALENNADNLNEVVAELLLPYQEANYDVVILGCTHYILLANEIKTVLNTRLVDSSQAILNSFNYLESSAEVVVGTSGSTNVFEAQIKQYFNRELKVLSFKEFSL